MPRPDFTNRGSPKAWRKRSRVWLTADWVTPNRTAARDTPPSSNTATKVARDLRSRFNISTGFMVGSLGERKGQVIRKPGLVDRFLPLKSGWSKLSNRSILRHTPRNRSKHENHSGV